MTAHFAAKPAEVRQFVVQAISEDRPHLAKAIQEHFGVSRSTAHNYLAALIDEGLIVRSGLGRYDLAHRKHEYVHEVQGLEEDEVWSKELFPVLSDLPKNVLEIWHYGCTEMLNNVIDHSESQLVGVSVDRTAQTTTAQVHDEGIGIFRKISNALGLADDRHAVLELSKGKFTTDPENHTGEGIYFSSRAFDYFTILSGDVYYHHRRDDHEDWILGEEHPSDDARGTLVTMRLRNDAARTLKEVFDAYATDTEDYRFDRTVVPVALLQYGDDRLVSRSQAKRLLNRFDRFRCVILDFQDVESIGQAFADEVFRVFTARHPEIELIAVNTNEQVQRMINRVTRSLSQDAH